MQRLVINYEQTSPLCACVGAKQIEEELNRVLKASTGTTLEEQAVSEESYIFEDFLGNFTNCCAFFISYIARHLTFKLLLSFLQSVQHLESLVGHLQLSLKRLWRFWLLGQGRRLRWGQRLQLRTLLLLQWPLIRLGCRNKCLGSSYRRFHIHLCSRAHQVASNSLV